MKRLFIVVLLGAVAFFSCAQSKKAFIGNSIDFAQKQYEYLLAEANKNPQSLPRTTNNNGQMKGTNIYDWTSGFFPGCLWYLYELSGDVKWLAPSQKWTEVLEPIKDFYGHHDIGFMIYCSYGNGVRLTKNGKYDEVIVQTSKSLLKRYNPKVGCIQSWNIAGWQAERGWKYPVIIDNMMNLEMLFYATKITGDSSFFKVAVSHADKTLKNHYRKDHSSYHVIDYDPETGEVRNRNTAQGYAHESSWARGQAWGLYGFTFCYRETGYSRYLEQAQAIADYILNYKGMPEDLVPFWDYNSPKIPNDYRDASAAAVTASALFDLSKMVKGTKGEKYKNAAIKILKSLSSPAYRAKLGQNGNFILMHSVGSIPHNSEIDVPLIYADYYYLEALLKYKNTK
jgi:Highly conserved protein containing a thioredoxin domain